MPQIRYAIAADAMPLPTHTERIAHLFKQAVALVWAWRARDAEGRVAGGHGKTPGLTTSFERNAAKKPVDIWLSVAKIMQFAASVRQHLARFSNTVVGCNRRSALHHRSINASAQCPLVIAPYAPYSQGCRIILVGDWNRYAA